MSAPTMGTPNKLKSSTPTIDDFKLSHEAELSPVHFALYMPVEKKLLLERTNGLFCRMSDRAFAVTTCSESPYMLWTSYTDMLLVWLALMAMVLVLTKP